MGQILLTGKDIAINDFSGDPSLSYSERRLRRSPFVDLASMVMSIYEVAFMGVLNNKQLHEEDVPRLLPMGGLLAHYMSGWFVLAYRERIGLAAGPEAVDHSAGDVAGCVAAAAGTGDDGQPMN